MADIFGWSSTAGSNTTVDGINIAEGCPAGNMNNAARSIMALVRNTFASGLATFFAGSAALPVASGGTGSTTAGAALTALGAAKSGANSDITSLTALSTALSIAQGGTGQTTGPAALAALGLTYTSNANGQCVTVPIGGVTILVQWGQNYSGSDTWSANYTLPVAFSSTANAMILANSTILRNSAADGNSISSVLVSASQYKIGNDDIGAYLCNWLAVGLG